MFRGGVNVFKMSSGSILSQGIVLGVWDKWPGHCQEHFDFGWDMAGQGQEVWVLPILKRNLDLFYGGKISSTLTTSKYHAGMEQLKEIKCSASLRVKYELSLRNKNQETSKG